MTEQFDAKSAEIWTMFNNQLEQKRTAEIRERMLAAGIGQPLEPVMNCSQTID